jgi:hypothetical protein
MQVLEEQWRSRKWFFNNDFRSFNHRSRILQLGWSLEEIKDRPIIGILNTWSGLNACHMHFPDGFGGEKPAAGYGLFDRALGAMYIQGLWEGLAKSDQRPKETR